MSNKDALWNQGRDETVEVNQRALIDKVLARYSGEFTVFRELLQNADDAGASSVQLHFETRAFLDKQSSSSTSNPNKQHKDEEGMGLPDLKQAIVAQWTFKNNGSVFREEDWSRLKKIAEGNPDEQKIGAFGVGFYSLFSVTEEPFVKSGKEWMGFYWKDKKDQLFARRGTLPQESASPWTSFEMLLREPQSLPGRPMDIARFLASSITFMTNLKQVSMYFDDKRLAMISKDAGTATPVVIPREMGPKSITPKRTMNVKAVTATPLNIKAQVLRWVYATGSEKALPPKPDTLAPKPATATGFLSSWISSFSVPTPSRTPEPQPSPHLKPKVDLLEVIDTSVLLSVFAAQVAVTLDQKAVNELERATKKKPPKSCTYQLIYTGKDEYDASDKEDFPEAKAVGSIFQGLRADVERRNTSRIYIGHATGQTTGIAGHMAARFIPTVERESIDLVDRNVSVWNTELLNVGGFLCRVAYETEMASIKRLYLAASESGSPDADLNSWLLKRCLHALKFFTFQPSTPSSDVSRIMSSAFFASSDSFNLFSSAGVKTADLIRITNPEMKDFIKTIPTLSNEIQSGAAQTVGILQAQGKGKLKEIGIDDIVVELKSRCLDEQEMVMCLKWRAGLPRQPDFDSHFRQQLLAAAVYRIPGKKGEEERLIPLSTITKFVNSSGLVPLDGPFPPTTIPFSTTKHISGTTLTELFGWLPFSLNDWIAFLAGGEKLPVEQDIASSPHFAEHVLVVLARGWSNTSKAHQEEISKRLANVTCLPTQHGLKIPSDAYFPSAHIFPDLPTVTLPSGASVKGPLEKVLASLGVRRHVDLQLVFNRMIKTGDWTIPQLVKYLASVKDTLTNVEMDRLRSTAAFTKAGEAVQRRYVLNTLYEPTEELKALGLPILEWGENPKWRPNSEEAKFLYQLGLKRHPLLADVLKLASDANNVQVRTTALKFFFEKFATLYRDSYQPSQIADLAFIPAVKPDGTEFLAKHKEVFGDPACAVMGFAVVNAAIREDALTKLRIARNPPTSAVIDVLLKSPPKDQAAAKPIFEYMTTFIGEFTPAELQRLGNSNIVPAKPPSSPTIILVQPTTCYFHQQSGPTFHSELFTFVDYGFKANAFLQACGVKQAPTTEEVAKMMVANPKKFYNLVGNAERFKSELRNIATNFNQISDSTKFAMKRAPMLLGVRQVNADNEEDEKKEKERGLSSPHDDGSGATEDAVYVTYELLRGNQIVIVDDVNTLNHFSDLLYAAPQEDILEKLYADLGSPRLSGLVKEDYQVGSIHRDQTVGQRVRKLVLERLPLFFHSRTQGRNLVRVDWLQNPSNFEVHVVSKLTLIKTLNFGTNRTSKSTDTSAFVKREGYSRTIRLYLNTNPDLYDVAHSLCKVLVETPRVNDSLLFFTILSTDLRSLRRRGFNVDRILNQQKVEREAKEKAERDAREQERKEWEAQEHAAQVPGAFVNEKPPPQPDNARKTMGAEAPAFRPPQPDNAGRTAGDAHGNGSEFEPPNRTTSLAGKDKEREKEKGLFNAFRNRFPTPQTSSSVPPSLKGGLDKFMSKANSLAAGSGSGSGTARSGTSAPKWGGGRDTNAQPTPESEIDKNVQQAINACRPEARSLLQNREEMNVIKEALDEGYCDVQGMEGNLAFIDTVIDTKVYVDKSVPDARNLILTTKVETILRFLTILSPLKSVFQLPPTSVHIFYNLSGPTIAFNAGGALFVNLRYYEGWHDAQVARNDYSKALVSWYFTLAHEIAHNLVGPHNAEHSYYMNQISGKHLLGLMKVLQENTNPARV